MRILFVSQWFTPEPMFKGLPFARVLVERGHEVQVLTGFPNYPGGRIYHGYNVRILQRESMEGVQVIRVMLYPSHDTSIIRRIANYLSFAVSAATIGLVAVRKADVMYVYHPPATVSLPALIIGWIRKIPFVYDIQDLWPDTLKATGMIRNRILMEIVERWCKLTYRYAARIVVLSRGFKEVLESRGVPSSRIEVIYNWCEEWQVPARQSSQCKVEHFALSDRFNVVFAGTMGKAQSLDIVLEAAKTLMNKIPEVQFVFVGGGVDVDRLKQLAVTGCIRNVLFLPWRPITEIQEVLSHADVLLVHLKKDPLFRITIPSKIQAYLFAGRPLLAGVEGDAAELVMNSQAGIIYNPGSPQSLADAVERLYRFPKATLERMGKNGQRFYADVLSLSKGVDRFERVFQSVVRKHQRPEKIPIIEAYE